MVPEADGFAVAEGYCVYLRVSLLPVDGDQLVLATAETYLLGVLDGVDAVTALDALTQIADRMNFTSLSYFSRYCTKHLGQSPSDYRRSLQPRG